MSDQVLYKGLRKDGKGWIYGDYCIKGFQGLTYINRLELGGSSIGRFYEVYPETVRLCTKINRIDFCVDDIITNDSEQIWVVMFLTGAFVAVHKSHINDLERTHILLRGIKGAKVIGNIHENQDLLK